MAGTAATSRRTSAASSTTETKDEKCGTIHFWRNFGYDVEGKPFVRVNHDCHMHEVCNIMTQEWKIQTPRIVLLLISNVAPLSRWKNSKQIKSFQKGIMNAANTTDMWIMTNGMNLGLSKVIGDAVQEEINRRISKGLPAKGHKKRSKGIPRIVLVGVTREDLLNHVDLFTAKNPRVELENEGNRPEEQKYDLNPDHSHFLIVKDSTISKNGINYFLLRLQHYLATSLDHPRKSAAKARRKASEVCLGTMEIPVVAVLVQGGTDCARLVLDHLKRHLPLVVMSGTGGLADILGFAYTEVSQRPQGIADAEFSENYLKPELSRKIAEKIPKLQDNSLARNIFRDRIIDCIRFAKQNEHVYMTILNLHQHSCDLENIGNVLLQSLFKSQKTDNTNWHVQMQKDLYLTLDWNSPHVATAEVFMKDPTSKFKIEKDVFEEALLRSQRESFVDLFLNQGFQVHKYLTPKRLLSLFKKIQSQEFFKSVCWEGALGYGPMARLNKDFIDRGLNVLIEKTTSMSYFVSTQELSLNGMGMYLTDPSSAERKAKILLVFWAIFNNRISLAKILWKHADHPIHLALVLSMMIEKLVPYVRDTTLSLEMENNSRDFAEFATSMLDACYQDAPSRAFEVLNEESTMWGTAVDIAAEAHNRRFLSHICCQKWLTNEFYGKIRVRELSWGLFTVPTSMKILMCAFFVFPMYLWIVFQTAEYDLVEEKEATDPDSDDEGDGTALIPNGLTSTPSFAEKKVEGQEEEKKDEPWIKTEYLRNYVVAHPPLWKMIYLVWSAPVTKFWTFHVFYIAFLALFSIAVMWPSCGHNIIDITVCSWMSLIALESIHPAVKMRSKRKSSTFLLKITETIVMIVFVILYALGRLVQVSFLDSYTTRVILCLELLYFYYRVIAIFLPISRTLGPLLYRVRLMVLVDFMNFMRMTILVIISGGIVIHAVMYPDYPFDKELFRRTFHKAWFSLFLTPISDLTEEEQCPKPPDEDNGEEVPFCRAGEYKDWKCPNVGFWAYVFNIQYFVLLKLILLTLLYALFSATATKLSAESDAIWKFQRYQLVIDFSNRLRLPAPLNIISYIILITRCFIWLTKNFCCLFCRKCKKEVHPVKDDEKQPQAKDYSYWKHLAEEFSTREQLKVNEVDLLEKHINMVENLIEDFNYQKQMMHQLKAAVRDLERLTNYTHVHVENIRNLTMRDSADHWDTAHEPNRHLAKPVMNVLARRSPYPGTRVQRFPVPDKYVPWEVMWISYDPVAYTRPRIDFPVTIQSYVDEDILLLRERHGSQMALPVYSWNSVSINPTGICLDRQSWIASSDGSPLVYLLDGEDMPQNPMGRTGLRGRGCLPRWGPNHYVLTIITRFQRTKDTVLAGRGLEFVVAWTERQFQLSLPGIGNSCLRITPSSIALLGSENIAQPSGFCNINVIVHKWKGFVSGEHRYEVIRMLFRSEATGTAIWQSQDNVIQFFKSQATEASATDQEESAAAEDKVSCEMVMRGYMDDPLNTDHAWKEVELWHIHYDTTESIADSLQRTMGWRLVTEDAFFKLPAGQAALLQDIAKKMKATIL